MSIVFENKGRRIRVIDTEALTAVEIPFQHLAELRKVIDEILPKPAKPYLNNNSAKVGERPAEAYGYGYKVESQTSACAVCHEL